MNNRRQAARYLGSDILGVSVAWLILSRNNWVGDLAHYDNDLSQYILRIGMFILLWLFICSFFGFYNSPFRKSRLTEFTRSITIPVIFIGIISIFSEFFSLSLAGGTSQLLLIYTSIFLPTYIPRVSISSITNFRIRKGSIVFRTLLIGSGDQALSVKNRILNEPLRSGYEFIGFLRERPDEEHGKINDIPLLGSFKDLDTVLKEHSPEEVIIALDPKQKKQLPWLIGELSLHNVLVKTLPSADDSIITRLQYSEIFGTPLVKIQNTPLTDWESNIKRVIDLIFSIVALLLLTPLILVLTVAILVADGRPVIYTQIRTGRFGRDFRLYKFRSMIRNAEVDEPLLSRKGDPRITTIGRFMRKHRFDEIPNLINVIKGEMSLVGPRPERPYYVEKIVKKAPQYKRLLTLKPGVTSWGQVKYGYASDIDQMIERMEYEQLYLENRSLLLDFKIAIYTFLIIILGRGV